MRPPGGKIRSQIRSSGSNCPARASVSPSGPTTTLAAVEDQLVLAAHHVAEGEGRPVGAGALGHHRLAGAALAAVVRRGGGVDDQAGARRHLVVLRESPDARCPRRRSGRRACRRSRSGPAPCPARSSGARRRPRSWADRTCGRSRAPRRRRERRASCRPGEGTGRSAGRSPRAPEAGRSMRSGKPTRATIALDLRGEGVERLTDGVQEVAAQQEVLGRVAGEAELRQQHQLRAAVAGAVDRLRDQARRCPRCRPRWGRSGPAPAADVSTRPWTQVWPHRRGEQTHPWLGLPCRACSGRRASPRRRRGVELMEAHVEDLCREYGIELAGLLVSRARDPLARRQARDLDPADPRPGLLLHRPPRDRAPGRAGTLGSPARVRGERLALGARAQRGGAHAGDLRSISRRLRGYLDWARNRQYRRVPPRIPPREHPFWSLLELA